LGAGFAVLRDVLSNKGISVDPFYSHKVHPSYNPPSVTDDQEVPLEWMNISINRYIKTLPDTKDLEVLQAKQLFLSFRTLRNFIALISCVDKKYQDEDIPFLIFARITDPKEEITHHHRHVLLKLIIDIHYRKKISQDLQEALDKFSREDKNAYY